MEFKAGDQVRIVELIEVDERDTNLKIGDVGTFVGDGSGSNCLVRFDEEKIKNKAKNWDYELKAYVMFADQIEKVEDTKMTKKDLESGMVVEIRDGRRYLVIKKADGINFMNLDGTNHFDEKYMKDDMTFPEWRDRCDIMRIYRGGVTLNDCKTTKDLLWERKEPKEMTVAEIEAALGYPVKVVK